MYLKQRNMTIFGRFKTHYMAAAPELIDILSAVSKKACVTKPTIIEHGIILTLKKLLEESGISHTDEFRDYHKKLQEYAQKSFHIFEAAKMQAAQIREEEREKQEVKNVIP